MFGRSRLFSMAEHGARNTDGDFRIGRVVIVRYPREVPHLASPLRDFLASKIQGISAPIGGAEVFLCFAEPRNQYCVENLTLHRVPHLREQFPRAENAAGDRFYSPAHSPPVGQEYKIPREDRKEYGNKHQ